MTPVEPEIECRPGVFEHRSSGHEVRCLGMGMGVVISRVAR